MTLRPGSRTRNFILLLFAIPAASGTLAQAEIAYRVAVLPEQKKLAVTITIPAQAGPVSLQMPNWMPGAYVLGNFYQNVKDVTATDANGNSLTVSHPDLNTWTVNASGSGPVKVSYSVPSASRRFGGSETSFIQISGATAYMYVVGRKTEACRVSFELPNGWPMAIGLDAVSGAQNTYTADSYDTLADNPVSTGDLIVREYNLKGKPHYFVLEGAAKKDVDQARLMRDCQWVSAAETDFFGNVPYNKYVWHFAVNDAADGAGGLEHLSSTQIGLSSGEGPRAQSVMFHEYFHLWNVKRIRSKPLGPFDYLALPKTGALWWLEGVTDYYASLLPYRYGMWTRDQYFGQVIRNLNAVRSNAARLEVSPYQASYRVGDANEGRGNSNGYKISYYNLGWLCGMCLDTEIRVQSGGKHSLDDVEHALFELCKNNKPGFEEDEIRKQAIHFGGPSLGEFYDKVVMTPGELPVEEQLAKMGLKVEEQDETGADYGFRYTPSKDKGGAAVRDLTGPAVDKLKADDVIESVNGQSVALDSNRKITETMTSELDKAKAGVPMMLKVKRGGAEAEVQIDPVATTRKVKRIVDDPAATSAAVALRNKWLITKTVPMR